MKVSELIKELELKQQQYGDVDVYRKNYEGSGISLDKDIFVIGGVCIEERFIVIE